MQLSGWTEVNTVFWLTTYLSRWEFCRSGPAAGQRIYWPRDSVREKTNKHPRPNIAQPFFPKFSCVLQSSQEKLKTLLTLPQFCLGEENGGDKQVLLMIQRRLAGVRFSVLLKTLSLHVFFFNAFLFLVCPFWSGVGYDFRGNYGSGWTYLWF